MEEICLPVTGVVASVASLSCVGVVVLTRREGCLCQHELQVYSMLQQKGKAWKVTAGGVTGSSTIVQFWSTKNNFLCECPSRCLCLVNDGTNERLLLEMKINAINARPLSLIADLTLQ